jgi:hypothetical protein
MFSTLFLLWIEIEIEIEIDYWLYELLCLKAVRTIDNVQNVFNPVYVRGVPITTYVYWKEFKTPLVMPTNAVPSSTLSHILTLSHYIEIQHFEYTRAHTTLFLK